MKIGFIGTGNMGGAILKGYALSEASRGNTLLIANRNHSKSEAIASELRDKSHADVQVCKDNCAIAKESQILVLGVKPVGMADLLEEIKTEASENKIFVSMAAGVSIDAMKKQLGENAKVIRIMPNTPAMVGKAMTSISPCNIVTEEELSQVKSIFDSIGKSEVVGEEMIDCVIGVSGSSPAYTYMYIEALANAAVKRGMAPEAAKVFAAQSVLGAAEMVLAMNESPKKLRENVCSPGGTTIEAVQSLEKNDFMGIVEEAFEAAVNKSILMTGGNK